MGTDHDEPCLRPGCADRFPKSCSCAGAPDAFGFEAHVGARGFSTAHSSDASYHLEGTVNIPLIADQLALRVVAYQDDIAGFIDNKFAGQSSVDYGAALGLPDGLLVTPAVPAFTRKDINSEDTGAFAPRSAGRPPSI